MRVLELTDIYEVWSTVQCGAIGNLGIINTLGEDNVDTLGKKEFRTKEIKLVQSQYNYCAG